MHEDFNPSEHTVTEVLSYLEDHPDEADAVVTAEKADRNRSGIVGEAQKVTGVVFDRDPETGALKRVSS